MQAEKFINLLYKKPNKAVFYLYMKKGPIVKWIMANNGSKDDAKDILQDAVILMIDKLRWSGSTLKVKPEYYLFGIVKNLWLSKLRADKKHQFLKEQMQLHQDTKLELINLKGLEKELESLGKRCKQLLQLFYLENHTMQQIAKVMNFRNDKVAKAMKYKCLQKAKTSVLKENCYENEELPR